MALVRNSTSSRRQAIDFDFFIIKFPKCFAKEARFLSSYHISFINYLDSNAFPMIDCSQVIGKAGNKEYADLHFEPMNAFARTFSQYAYIS